MFCLAKIDMIDTKFVPIRADPPARRDCMLLPRRVILTLHFAHFHQPRLALIVYHWHWLQTIDIHCARPNASRVMHNARGREGERCTPDQIFFLEVVTLVPFCGQISKLSLTTTTRGKNTICTHRSQAPHRRALFRPPFPTPYALCRQISASTKHSTKQSKSISQKSSPSQTNLGDTLSDLRGGRVSRQTRRSEVYLRTGVLYFWLAGRTFGIEVSSHGVARNSIMHNVPAPSLPVFWHAAKVTRANAVEQRAVRRLRAHTRHPRWGVPRPAFLGPLWNVLNREERFFTPINTFPFFFSCAFLPPLLMGGKEAGRFDTPGSRVGS